MVREKIKEAFFKTQFTQSFKEYLDYATHFTGIKIRSFQFDLSYNFSYAIGNENPFRNNSLKTLLELADRCAAHEAGESLYNECMSDEKAYRVLGEFVGEYFARVLRKKKRKHALAFEEVHSGVYQIANELVDKISEYPFREQILFLHRVLFGKPPSEIKELIGDLEGLDSKFPYEN